MKSYVIVGRIPDGENTYQTFTGCTLERSIELFTNSLYEDEALSPHERNARGDVIIEFTFESDSQIERVF
jgi:hypothetical protein